MTSSTAWPTTAATAPMAAEGARRPIAAPAAACVIVIIRTSIGAERPRVPRRAIRALVASGAEGALRGSPQHAAMFDSLSDKLQATLGDLRSRGKLTEADLDRAMREIRLALLEADVNFKVVRTFVNAVRERAVGGEVLGEPQPGPAGRQDRRRGAHRAARRHDRSKLVFAQRPPTVILLCGLQGSGKTTAAGKLAKLLAKQGKRPALVACDVYRPAAVEQLRTLGAAGRRARVRPRHRRRPRRDRRVGRRERPQRRAATSSSSTPPAACTSTRS